MLVIHFFGAVGISPCGLDIRYSRLASEIVKERVTCKKCLEKMATLST